MTKKKKKLLGPDSIFLFGFTNAKVKLLVMYRLQMRTNPFTLPFFFFFFSFWKSTLFNLAVWALLIACTEPILSTRPVLLCHLLTDPRPWVRYYAGITTTKFMKTIIILYIYIYIITLTPLHKLAEPYQRADTKKKAFIGRWHYI